MPAQGNRIFIMPEQGNRIIMPEQGNHIIMPVQGKGDDDGDNDYYAHNFYIYG